MPPAPLRRPVTFTLWLVLSVVVLVLSPLILAAGAIWSAVIRRPQPLLLTRFLLAYFARELGVLVTCGGLWLATGFGLRMRSAWSQRQHNRLLRWFVHGLAVRALELLRIELAPDPSPEAEAALERDRPLLYFSRHAGPGDTAFIVDLLIERYRRLPSVVFKDTLAIDPSVDLIGHRLPHAVLDTSDPEGCEERIEEVAAQLRPRGVLLLFPEGGNFTPQRRRRALRKLRRKGRHRQAAQAEKMQHVMPPHPGGALAALRGNPGADVLFGAHTGLGLAAWPSDIWRNTPIGRTFKTHVWVVPARDRPTDPDEQEQWLYGWWRRLDDWVDEQGEETP
ncbi:MAG TPA: 1-acyl-sn-glycerol-3-phosphate acyltransferase [Candidatus Limnocylindria bacterium]|nr:1-acyl-sn-glycerol-3-phosphate acyltransferase [Candidatus Limnocylindria bacterium]